MLGLIVLAIEEEDGGAAFIPSEDLLGVRILARSIAGALPTKESVSGVLVAPESMVDSLRKDVVQEFGLDEIDRVVSGGPNRWAALRAGLAALPDDLDWVIIQDGHRALVPIGLVDLVLNAAMDSGAAAPAVVVRDATGQVGADGKIATVEERSSLRTVQWPQVFKRVILDDLVAKENDGSNHDFDLALFAASNGVTVACVDGDTDNIQIRNQRDIGRSLEAFSRRAVDYAFLYPRGMLPDDPLRQALAPVDDLDADLLGDEMPD
jgi:2-C-methyl-D-erythritol 4-phosphate cytidylyltransferase